MDKSLCSFSTTTVTAMGQRRPTKNTMQRLAVPSQDTMISTRLTERFGIRHPIGCAPMAFVTGGALAAAVFRARGVGIVWGGYAGGPGGETYFGTELVRG